MKGIRNQGQRIGRVAEDQFGNDEGGIERGADGEGPTEIVRRMAVPGVIMRMTMRMGMTMLVVIVRHCDRRIDGFRWRPI